MSINTITVLDTETTGVDPAEGAALLEIAAVVLDKSTTDTGWEIVYSFSNFVEFEGDIPPQARAVHHIAPAQVRPGAENCLHRSRIVSEMLAAEEPGSMIYAAHNAKFDRQFLRDLGQPVEEDTPPIPWVCTMRCAMHLWPDAPSYGNQVLRYWLGVEPQEHMLVEQIGEGYQPLAPHRALYDTACTAAILSKMLETNTAEHLVWLTDQPILLKNCRFGKHRGTPWAEMPRDYLQWMMRKSDMLRDDPDLAHTVRHHLGLPTGALV